MGADGEQSEPDEGIDVQFVAPPPVSTLGHAMARQRLRAALLGEAAQPVRVDRFALERELGHGGMGTVWLAHDAQLDRQVALKFLRRAADGEAAEQRLFREAQGLAKISHPNVVPVYDVGRHEDRVWVAMEFVPGRTLRAWVASDEPTARARLEAWIAAGRGLAAVHAAGLVHRDVKPDNVMLGDDGRVRLVDFGLVRALASEADESEAGRTQEGSARAVASSGSGADPVLTQSRQFVGTVAYAAPEQRGGELVDARADQYAFCVAVWEALAGERPKLARVAQGGGLVPLPEGKRMAARLRTVLSRGLSWEPHERFADMDALLVALEPRRGRRVLVAGGVMGAVGLAMGLWAAPSDAVAEPCANTGRPIDERWGEERRDAMQAHDEDLAELVDDWSARWRGAAAQACEEVHVEQLRPETSLGPRRACLQERLDELDVLLEAEAEAEAGVDAGRSPVEWRGVLDDPALCLNPALLELDAAEPPEAMREEVSRIRRELLRVRWGIEERRIDRRRVQAGALYDAASALGFVPLVGRAADVRGRLATLAGASTPARQWLGEALDIGLRHDPTLAVDAWLGLQELAVTQQLDVEGAQWLAQRVDAALERLPVPGMRHANAVLLRGRVHLLRGELADAESVLEEAVTRYAALGDGVAWLHAGAMRQQAVVVELRGRGEEAAALHRRARALEGRSEADGALVHAGEATLNQGLALQEAGKLEQAESKLRRAVEQLAVEYGPGSVDVANAHVALAGLFDQRGELEAMQEHAAQADMMLVRIDPRHPDRLYSLTALGTVAYRQRHFDTAVDAYARALSIAERHLPSGSPDLAWNRVNLAEALLEHGEDGRAHVLLRRAMDVLESSLGAEHPDLAIPIKALGAVALVQGDAEESLRWLGRALTIVEDAPGSSVERAETHWLLARAHRAAGDPDAALMHAQRAEVELATLGAAWSERVAEIQRWRAQQ